MAEQRQRGTERLLASGVGGAQLCPVQIIAVEEERLPEILGRAKICTRALTRCPASRAASACSVSREPNAVQARYQLSRSPGVICAAIVRHSPTLAMPESALPTLRCS